MGKRLSQYFRKKEKKPSVQQARFLTIMIMVDNLTKDIACGTGLMPMTGIGYQDIYSALDKARTQFMQMEQAELTRQEAMKNMRQPGPPVEKPTDIKMG
jgi:hypothetical protein